MCIYIYIYIYTQTYTIVYIYIYIYTHTMIRINISLPVRLLERQRLLGSGRRPARELRRSGNRGRPGSGYRGRPCSPADAACDVPAVVLRPVPTRSPRIWCAGRPIQAGACP